MSVVIAAFYKFVTLPDYQEWQRPFRELCRTHEVKGIILFAAEGVNGTIAGSRSGVDAVLDFLRQDARLAELTHKESQADFMPFPRLKVKLKQEIVKLGLPTVTPQKQVGEYINSHEWNDLISDPDVVLIDTRNDFEVALGTFKGAINPKTDAFNEFPAFVEKSLDPAKHKKVAMFCTGGIRCEKATAYLLEQGFEEVFHLKDGILKYLEEVPEEETLWQGNCFVFDERITVDHALQPVYVELCPMCKTTISASDRASEKYEFGVSCPTCIENLVPEHMERAREKQRQLRLAREREATA